MGDHPDRPDVDLLSGSFWGSDPHDAFTWMRRHEPVFRDERSGVWAVTRYDDLKAVSAQPAVFSSAEGIRADAPAMPMMIDMDDPAHRTRRKLVSRGFTPKRVREQEGRIGQVCDEIIDKVCEQGGCDLVWDIAAPLPLIMIGDALGVAPEDRDDLLRWSDDMLKGLTGLDDDELMVKATAAHVEYSEYAERVINDRRENPRDDLMSVLVHAEVDGDRLDSEELIFESLLILIGGDETTRHVISGGAYQLLTHPDQQQRLVDEPAAIPTAVEEMLRWVSPIKNMARTVVADTDVGGQWLSGGDSLLLVYPSANRDEDVFEDPFRFDIARTPNDHVAFGFGTHFCLGNSLARLELRVMFERLLARLPDLALAHPGAGEPAYRPANFVSGYESMPVRFTPTNPIL